MTPKVINFYNTPDDYGYFCNFSDHPIVLDGKTWPTAEHYFQAMKFEDEGLQEKIRLAKGPGASKAEGNDRNKPLRQDWEQIKYAVMKKALAAKFTQHLDLYTNLMDTGSAIIVERTENDAIWGDGGDGRGTNLLGKALMDVREFLRV